MTLLTAKHAGISTACKNGEESRNEKTFSEAKQEEPPEDFNQGSLPVEAAQPEQQKGSKSLKDAVKPKHKRKRKQSSTGAS